MTEQLTPLSTGECGSSPDGGGKAEKRGSRDYLFISLVDSSRLSTSALQSILTWESLMQGPRLYTLFKRT